MSIRKRIIAASICGTILIGNVSVAFADSANVVTLGKDLSAAQKQTVLDYFGVKESEVVVLEVNNAEERKYLEGIASEAQIGHKTFSNSFVEPTGAGSGVKVKTVNLTYVTSSMIASTLATCGIADANVVAMSPMPVSGTGALTGVMKAFEDATGEKLPEEKKEIASEELIITGKIGDDIGTDKATGVINDIKTEIIKNNTKDTIQIAETITNVTNNYNVTLTDAQQKQIEDLMGKIAKQDYDYNSMKETLETVGKDVNDKLEAMGESINKGFFDSIGDFFGGIGDWFSNLFAGEKDLGILGSTNDEMLGDNVVVDATTKDAIKLPSKEEAQGFFSKILEWFTGLFDGGDKTPTTETPEITEPTIGGGQEEVPTDEETLENDKTDSPTSNDLNNNETENKDKIESTEQSTETNTDDSQTDNTNTENKE